MAEISGVDGSVDFEAGKTYVKSWTLSYVGDALETTNFDSTGATRTYIAGLTGWSGSFDALYSTSNTAVPSSTGTINLKSGASTGVGNWSGSVIITGMDITTPRDGLVTQSYTFQGTGTLAASTA
ncbi:hypothetical protein ES708_16128 [subsurface metagenome]